MRGKLYALGFVLVLSTLGTLIVSGCGPATAEPAEPPTAESRPVVHSIDLREGDTYEIALDADPASDDKWEVEFSDVYLELVDRISDGAAGKEVFTFRARAVGVTEAYFSYSRRHEAIYSFTIGADPALADAMSEAQAREIAASSECGEAGALKETSVYNDWTATWWIDLDVEQEGCNPACVVDVRTGRAEINWRCTGALPPGDETREPAPMAELPTETPVAEVPTPASGHPIVARGGFVQSLPADAGFDDFAAFEPEGAGASGLTGAGRAISRWGMGSVARSRSSARSWRACAIPAPASACGGRSRAACPMPSARTSR